MKKNLMTVIILALVLVNLVLTAILAFTIIPQTRKSNQLIDKIASAIDLELEDGSSKDTAAVPVEDIEVYDIEASFTVNLSPSGDGKDHVAVFSIGLSLNTKSDGYKSIGTEGLKAKEQENLEAKTAICEQIENIDFPALKSFKDWEEKNKEVIALQDKWKTIGFAPKKSNVKIFERFRAACDVYFNRKSEFYKNIKDEMEKNLALKKALCEKAEALKDSTDWKSTTEKMIALQKEWKTIGSVARKHSDAVWKRFITACDYFFEQKNKNVSSQKSVEQTNLAAKKALIEKINTIDEADHDEALATLKGYMAEWNAIGHVPFKEKDKIYKEYHEAVDKQFDRLKVDQNDRKMQTFRNSLSDMSNGERGKGKLYGEREKLMRMYERMKNELQTYENNIGFLSISSKGGGGLLKEMERKIDKLKDEMALIIKKIDAIDENLE